MLQIAKSCGRAESTIHRWLHKLNISVRSISEAVHLSEANHCELSKEAIEWIDGELLGDGCMSIHSSYSACFCYASKYPEYIQYVKDTLESFGIEGGKIYKRLHKRLNCYYYSYASHFYIELLPIHLRWYPNGKKIVPKDIVLTPLTVRQWFIGDGSLKKPKGNRQPKVELGTYNFSIPDVNWLINQLVNLGFKATRKFYNNYIYISTYSTKAFLNYIGKCPVECYQYKFSYNK